MLVQCVGSPVSVHALSIRRLTGYRCGVVFFPSPLKFEVVDVRVHSEITYCRKISF